METCQNGRKLPKSGIVIELPIRDGNAYSRSTSPFAYLVIELPIRDGN